MVDSGTASSKPRPTSGGAIRAEKRAGLGPLNEYTGERRPSALSTHLAIDTVPSPPEPPAEKGWRTEPMSGSFPPSAAATLNTHLSRGTPMSATGALPLRLWQLSQDTFT